MGCLTPKRLRCSNLGLSIHENVDITYILPFFACVKKLSHSVSALCKTIEHLNATEDLGSNAQPGALGWNYILSILIINVINEYSLNFSLT